GPDEELLPVASEPASAIPTLMEVKAWARAAGGWFAAGNSPMGGARITLTLPAVRLASDALVQSVASGGPAAYGAGGAVPAGSAYSVLYADENLARRSNACLDLGEDGRFAVSHAPTSELAGVLLNDGGFDVIVVDLEDPANDGDELWRFLGETAPHVLSRILFTVGDGTSPAARRFLSRAGRPWLQRPVTASTLAALTAAIGRSTVALPETS